VSEKPYFEVPVSEGVTPTEAIDAFLKAHGLRRKEETEVKGPSFDHPDAHVETFTISFTLLQPEEET
jgi:hypothetical protein